MLRAIRISCILFLWANSVAGQVTGVVHRHVTGLGVRLPLNWSVEDQPEAIILSPPGAGAAEIYVAVSQTGYSIADERQFVEQMSAGFMRRGAQLVRPVEREAFTAGARPAALHIWGVVGAATEKRYGLRMYLSSMGSRAFAIVAMGPADLVRSHDSELRQVLSGMDFAAYEMPAGAPLADGTPLAQQWLAKLRGKAVKQFISGGGAAG